MIYLVILGVLASGGLVVLALMMINHDRKQMEARRKMLTPVEQPTVIWSRAKWDEFFGN
jgi:preprotein translocase subunit YajC